MFNFTTVPGEGYGDNGQGTELELLINAKLSRQVEVNARIHSRFSQNEWTNFGGFGGHPVYYDLVDTSTPPDGIPDEGRPRDCTGGDCGEFDPRSNQYVKLRGAQVILTPGYSWIDRALIGSHDLGQFDPFVVGRIRYIDRDNAAGIFLTGSALGRKVTWDAARISLPRLWAGPNYETGDYNAIDATYAGQIRYAPSEKLDFGLIGQYTNDSEIDASDNIFDDGRDLTMRFVNQVGGVKVGVRPVPWLDVKGALYYSQSDSNPIADAPGSFGINGYSPVPAGEHDDLAWYLNFRMEDPIEMGLSLYAQVFSIGADYVSIMAARREADVLLTEGWDSTWAFPGPSNRKYGVFPGASNQSVIGYGGWSGTAQQLPTINVDNEFTDFDEPMAETVIGWQGVTLNPVYATGPMELRGEYSYITYDTNWQAWGDDSRPITSTEYPGAELDAGVGHNFRSAYAPFSDRQTQIVAVNGKYRVEAAGGFDLFGRVKYIYETDKRMNDAKYLPYAAGDCPGGGVACTGTVNTYNGTNSTADIYGNPGLVGGGYQWKPFDSLDDDDRELDYWAFSLGVGRQVTSDLYLALSYHKYLVDLVDGNTAFQAYNLQQMAGGKHDKNQVILTGKYILAGVEFGLEGQYNFGTYEPDFGGGYVVQTADATIAAQHNVKVGSRGFTGRFGGWNSLEEQEFTHYRLKAFMKAQF